MSIAIQALAALQATSNAPISRPVALPAPLVRTIVKPVSPAIIAKSEFQQGPRNARIERLASGEHSVLCYDASTDYNELLILQSAQAAVESAEAWVKRKF